MFDTEALGPVFSFDPSGHLPLKGFASFFSRRHIFLSACYRSSLVAHHVGYLGYPFQNKQGKSCVEHLARDVDKEEKFGVVVIISPLL